jgi:16S rRNA (guanine527-N7)-methyltransferase
MALSELGTAWEPRIIRVFTALDGSADRMSADLSRDLCRLLDLVVSWNARVDLTAARDADELVDLFLADALVVARGPAPSGQRWVDVGTGAGAPGLTLALLRPDLAFTLVEPKDKRVAFLRTVLGSLGRVDVHVERSRSDALPDASFDVAISRATLSPDRWLAEGTRVAGEAVWVLVARDPPPAHQGWRIGQEAEYRWPLTDVPRRALCFVRDDPR